jgi:hypothetical protein
MPSSNSIAGGPCGYVGAESADFIHRVRFGQDGTVVDKNTPIGELPNEMEGPHGLVISPGGKYLH